MASPFFVRTAGDVIPFPQKGNQPQEEEYDASYPGVSKYEKDIAFGRINPNKEFGMMPDSNYRPPGEF